MGSVESPFLWHRVGVSLGTFWTIWLTPGRRTEGEEGIAFETEEERQQWEDDQRVRVWCKPGPWGHQALRNGQSSVLHLSLPSKLTETGT